MSWHWSIIGTSFHCPSQGPVWSEWSSIFKKKSLPKLCTTATAFIYSRLWKRKELETVMTQEIIMVLAFATRLTNVFSLDRPSATSDLGNRGWVWVQDKGPSVRIAAQALCSEMIPANAQTNVCSTVLMPPPETSSTRRLELENKQLPNPNIYKTIGQSFCLFQQKSWALRHYFIYKWRWFSAIIQ